MYKSGIENGFKINGLCNTKGQYVFYIRKFVAAGGEFIKQY